MGRRIAAPDGLPAGVVLRRGRWIPALGGWLAGMRRPAAAVTIGDVIVVHPDAVITGALLRHELAHVGQWRAAPLSFPIRYVIGHLRHGYHDNPYEIEARRAERDAGERR